MDKFGIFKLLNSFLPALTGDNNPQQTDNLNTTTDTISNLFSSLKNNSSSENNNATPPKPTPKPTPPLQTKMLATITSHDEFIKRVKEKHPAK